LQCSENQSTAVDALLPVHLLYMSRLHVSPLKSSITRNQKTLQLSDHYTTFRRAVQHRSLYL